MSNHRGGFGARSALSVSGQDYVFYRLSAVTEPDRLPYSIKILLESLMRREDGRTVTAEHIEALAAWRPGSRPAGAVPYLPARVVAQDFTGITAFADFAAMREALAHFGGDPGRINPVLPVDLVIDHSVIAESFGTPDAFARNADLEYARNRERYEFLRWAQGAFRNLRVVPPGKGILHQIHLEHLASVVAVDGQVAHPDSCIGMDSHTSMVNALGVLGWAVGGIEAEAVMLGAPMSMAVPRVVGVELTGRLPEGTTATDLVLTVNALLRQHGVVGAFVEFHGAGVASLPLATRATVSNMAPEYGCTVAMFAIDDETLRYLRLTGRAPDQVALAEAYAKEQGLWHEPASAPEYSERLHLDLGGVVACVAGPTRPQDRIPLTETRQAFRETLREVRPGRAPQPPAHRQGTEVRDGDVVIAAITSCTNTSNPSVMVGAALVAKRAVERGLASKPWVRTSLAPGSRVVSDYYERAGLTPYLDKLGFHLVGYGCTACIGNTGPLPEAVRDAVRDRDVAVAAVLSGNQNFEGRIDPQVRMSYLASPPLVVAYALAGTMDIDLVNDPLGTGADGEPVYLRDIWPSEREIEEVVETAIRSEMFTRNYADAFAGDHRWRSLTVPEGDLFAWDPGSTYVRKPPYFDGMAAQPAPVEDIRGARVLVKLGDTMSTDHITPSGPIAPDSPAGRHLAERGLSRSQLNSFGSRRSNHEVMLRAVFGNARLRNHILPGTVGSLTRDFTRPDGPVSSVYDAVVAYERAGVPLVVLAGKEYGTGSSRDCAAKNTALAGVHAVIAESFERIHRVNLIGVGVLPLQFPPGEGADSLGLTGTESVDVLGIGALDGDRIPATVRVRAGDVQFDAAVRLDTPGEALDYRHGGALQRALRSML